jgi:decaprenylphospho-beta-D-erythro-pentofuranosid-2-ulose 2-reductase
MSSAPAGSAGRRVIALGGYSEIALATVRELQVRSPREVVLVGRDPGALTRAAEDVRLAGSPRVVTLELDALNTDRHAEVVAAAFDAVGGGDIVILAAGVLGERGGLPADVSGAVGVLLMNVVAAGSLLLHAARRLRDGGGGALVVLSSVAAQRPRRANVVYAASKAGLDALAQGLGDALYEQGVHVLVVRPGFVHTRMTRGLQPAPLSTTPEAVARVIVGGLDRRVPTVWAPPALRWLMILVRMLPRSLFRRIEQ